MNILSCFDGMSCGRLALDKAGVTYNKYYASEVDKYAIKVSAANYPDTIQLGDIRDVKSDGLDIDLLIGGSPCQGFSFAGKQLNFDDPRSKLFFEFVRLKEELQPKYFLLENVKMKQESQDIISKYMGVEPIEINSSLVSAQSRRRLYWTNIPFEIPGDRGVVLKDILEDDSITDRDKSHCIDANYFKGGNLKSYFEKRRRQLVFDKCLQVGVADGINGHDLMKRVYSPDGKSPTLNSMNGGNREPKVILNPASIVGRRIQEGIRKDNDMTVPLVQCLEVQDSNKSRCLSTLEKDVVVSNLPKGRYPEAYDELLKPMWRKLTPLECERLQTVPDNYTAHVSNTQRYRMLGNGWTVDVIAHIFDSLGRCEPHDKINTQQWELL
jgi:site-specific DNA-cytosine methylase